MEIIIKKFKFKKIFRKIVLKTIDSSMMKSGLTTVELILKSIDKNKRWDIIR